PWSTGDQRRRESVQLRVLDAPEQLHAGGDVPPLIAAGDLERALARSIEVPEVVGLEQHVAEFRERQSTLHARLYRLLLHHDIDREVLPDIAQEIDQQLLPQPLRVVEQERGAWPCAKVQEPRRLIALATDVLADLLLGQQRPLARLPGGIADQPRA